MGIHLNIVKVISVRISTKTEEELVLKDED